MLNVNVFFHKDYAFFIANGGKGKIVSADWHPGAKDCPSEIYWYGNRGGIRPNWINDMEEKEIDDLIQNNFYSNKFSYLTMLICF